MLRVSSGTLSHRVTVLTPREVTSERGTPRLDYVTPVREVRDVPARVWQTQAAESGPDGQAVLTDRLSMLTTYLGLRAVDRVLWQGQAYAVDGTPLPGMGRDGRIAFLTANLKVVT